MPGGSDYRLHLSPDPRVDDRSSAARMPGTGACGARAADFTDTVATEPARCRRWRRGRPRHAEIIGHGDVGYAPKTPGAPPGSGYQPGAGDGVVVISFLSVCSRQVHPFVHCCQHFCIHTFGYRIAGVKTYLSVTEVAERIGLAVNTVKAYSPGHAPPDAQPRRDDRPGEGVERRHHRRLARPAPIWLRCLKFIQPRPMPRRKVADRVQGCKHLESERHIHAGRGHILGVGYGQVVILAVAGSSPVTHP